MVCGGGRLVCASRQLLLSQRDPTDTQRTLIAQQEPVLSYTDCYFLQITAPDIVFLSRNKENVMYNAHCLQIKRKQLFSLVPF